MGYADDSQLGYVCRVDENILPQWHLFRSQEKGYCGISSRWIRNFPRFGSRLEINRYLEERYNEAWGPRGEPLNRVPNYFWKEEYPEHEYVVREYTYNINKVSKPFRNMIVKIIADKADMDSKDVGFEMQLGLRSGMDSMDLRDIAGAREAVRH